MAVPAGTYQTYQQIGIREDLTNLIDMISPTDTPFYSSVEKVKATSTLHEWQSDSLAAPGSNIQIEGDDASVQTADPTTRLKNYLQILRKVPGVSGTGQAVNTAGRADEMDYQKMKRGREMKNDIEYALVRNQASSAGSASVGRSLASVESWLATNKTSVGTGTAQTTPGFSGSTVAAPTDSTVTGSVSEAALKSVIKLCWDAGGKPNMIMVASGNKQKLSTFGGIATQYKENIKGPATIVAAADAYVSDFGTFTIVPNHKMRAPTILVLDMDHWRVATLRGITSETLAKTGDSDKSLMLCEVTLESGNEAASGKITDVNPAL